MKKLLSLLLALCLLPFPLCHGSAPSAPEISAPAAILMERSSGSIIYEKDAYVRRAPASVTKLMTMLLVAEAVESGRLSLEDRVSASAAAAGMGGSQIWLEEGETMSVGEMLKCIAVVSANDCCVALAEHIAGSESAFVELMNRRAAELGLENSHFMCCSGLSSHPEHYSCAHDLAVIGRLLLDYDFIREYVCIRQDSIRDGEFILNNTNKLIGRYDGATGLKTGFTGLAMHCLAASAMRDGVEYIAVVLGAESSAERFESARLLLDYAFANFTTVDPAGLCLLPPLRVELGTADGVGCRLGGEGAILCPRSDTQLRFEPRLPESLKAPVEQGQEIGSVLVYRGEELLCSLPVLAEEGVERLGLPQILLRLLSSLFGP